MERNEIIQELLIAQRQLEQVGSAPALKTIKNLLKNLFADGSHGNSKPMTSAEILDIARNK